MALSLSSRPLGRNAGDLEAGGPSDGKDEDDEGEGGENDEGDENNEDGNDGGECNDKVSRGHDL